MCSKLYIPLLKPVEAGHAAHWWNGAQSWSKAKVPSLTDMSQGTITNPFVQYLSDVIFCVNWFFHTAPCRNVNDIT